MTFKFEQPPEELTWYYLPSLLAAEAGTLKYDPVQYSVHAVSNNAVACCWCGLLADGDGGLVLTDLGRRMLADWKASPKGQAWLAEWSALDTETDGRPEPTTVAPRTAPTHGDQLDLFAPAR